jgi:hypothetical protein
MPERLRAALKPALLMLVLACPILFAISKTPPLAQEIREQLPIGLKGQLRNPHYDILVVTVLAVDDDGATNENPPKLTLRIDEVLRGSSRPDTMPGVWFKTILEGDYDTAPGGAWITKQSWNDTPRKGPAVGSRFITTIMAAMSEELIYMNEYQAHPYSAVVRAQVVEDMAPPEHSLILVFILGGLIVLSPVAGTILVGIARARETPEAAKKRRIAFAVMIGSFPVYAFYESGISVYSNIRMDLLLIWPALIANVVLLSGAGFFSWWRKLRS